MQRQKVVPSHGFLSCVKQAKLMSNISSIVDEQFLVLPIICDTLSWFESDWQLREKIKSKLAYRDFSVICWCITDRSKNTSLRLLVVLATTRMQHSFFVIQSYVFSTGCRKN